MEDEDFILQRVPLSVLEQVEARRTQLMNRREALKNYLLSCFTEGDWHAVSDAANDLREVEQENLTLIGVQQRLEAEDARKEQAESMFGRFGKKREEGH